MATKTERDEVFINGQPTGVKARVNKSTPPARPKSDVPADLGVVPNWDSYPELVELRFSELVEKKIRLDDEVKFRQAQLGFTDHKGVRHPGIDDEIQALLAVAGAEKVTWEDRPVQVVHSRSGSKIVAEKLLMAGVPAQTIADATQEGKPYQYVLVGRPSKK